MRAFIIIGFTVASAMIGSAVAQRITTKTDSLGYTHYNGTGRSGQTFTGTSKTDSLGYTHSQFNDGGDKYNCTSKRDSLGYTHTDCH